MGWHEAESAAVIFSDFSSSDHLVGVELASNLFDGSSGCFVSDIV